VTVVDELYRAVIVEHGKRPRHRGTLGHPTHAAEGDNPLCGDALRVEVEVRDGVVAAAGFTGESCAIATASASLMSERLVGLTPREARRLGAAMEALCTTGAPGEGEPRLPADLLAFSEVHRHAVRIGCATLAWRILRRALAD
jgi:nitrogen fixation NifU-like protein